jgi:hypothetical protein
MTFRLVGAELFHADAWTDGWTDKHDEANSRFSQFYERAYKFYIMSTRCVSVFCLDLRTSSDYFLVQMECVY